MSGISSWQARHELVSMRLWEMLGHLTIMLETVDTYVAPLSSSSATSSQLHDMTDEYISRQIPKSMTHYVENIGTDDVVFIEVLQADHFSGMGSPLMHA